VKWRLLWTVCACTVVVACSSTPPAAATHTVRGVLLDVESPNIQKVDSFTLRTDEGQELHFTTAPNFNQGIAHLMTPGHMRQHMALGDPVEVTYRDDGSSGSLVAVSATDVSQ
jgi:hypothetical protein